MATLNEAFLFYPGQMRVPAVIAILVSCLPLSEAGLLRSTNHHVVVETALTGAERESKPCWEFLWTGHANVSALKDGVFADLLGFFQSVRSFNGQGHFAYYIDTPDGVETGGITPGQGEASAAGLGASSNKKASSFFDWGQGEVRGLTHFARLDQTGLKTALLAAAENLGDRAKTADCTRVATYSGHGYSFNGIGYNDNRFLPWDSFAGALKSSFGGPVDLLGLDTCRMATYLLLTEMEGTAKLILAHQDVDWYNPRDGSWVYDELPLAEAKNAGDLATRIMDKTYERGNNGGISLIDMQKFEVFSRSFEKLMTWLRPRISEEMPYLMQARREAMEFPGSSFYKPDNAGMLIDLGSFLAALLHALPADTPTAGANNNTSASTTTRALVADAVRLRKEAVALERHMLVKNAKITGMSIWFMKPEVNGMHRDLLRHLRHRLVRTKGGLWADFLETFYDQADREKLTPSDMAVPMLTWGPHPDSDVYIAHYDARHH